MKLNTRKKQYVVVIERGDSKAEFDVEPLASKESFGLLEEATSTKWKRGQKDEKTDFYKLKILRICRVIKGWRYVEDDEGNALPFSRENLELLYNYNQGVIDEVLDKAAEYGEIEDKALEEEVKNSKAGLDGKPSQE